MLLNRANLEVARFASKEESRYMLQAIYADSKETVATDGTVLLQVEAPKADEKEFPWEGLSVKQGADGKGLIPSGVALAVSKDLPRKSTIPILLNAAVDVAGGKIAVTDLEIPRSFEWKAVSGEFPNVENIMPKGEPVLRISLDARYLEMLGKFFREYAVGRVKEVAVSFYKENWGVKFEGVSEAGQAITGLLMPLHGRLTSIWPPKADKP